MLIPRASKLNRMDLAARLIEARTEALLSPAELAHRIGVAPSAVYQVEKGESKSLKGETLVNISHELNVSPRWLLLGKGPKRLSQGVSMTPEIISATQEVLALYLRFSDQSATLGRDPEMLAITLSLVLASDDHLSDKGRTELAIRLAGSMRDNRGRGDADKRGDVAGGGA